MRPRNPLDGEKLNSEEDREPLMPFQKTVKLNLATLKLNEVVDGTLSMKYPSTFQRTNAEAKDGNISMVNQLRHRRSVVENEIIQVNKILQLKRQSLEKIISK
jgi:hypothetical protein